MKFIERLSSDLSSGKLNEMIIKPRFTAAGIRWTYERIGEDGKPHYYASCIQSSNAYKIITEFIKSNGIKVKEV